VADFKWSDQAGNLVNKHRIMERLQTRQSGSWSSALPSIPSSHGTFLPANSRHMTCIFL